MFSHEVFAGFLMDSNEVQNSFFFVLKENIFPYIFCW